MTRTVHLQLVVDGDDGEPLKLACREVPDGEKLGAYDTATWLLETAARLITWQAFRDRTRDEFDSIVEQLGEAS